MRSPKDIERMIAELPDEATCFGYCAACDTVHYLTEGNSRKYAVDLMAQFEQNKRIDFDSTDPDLIFSTDCLWKGRGGQMFGVLECVDDHGETVVLRAFSGQFNTQWLADGWVPPTFDLGGYYKLLPEIEASVQQMTKDIESCKQIADQCELEFNGAMASGGRLRVKDYHSKMREAEKAHALAKKKRKSYSQSMMSAFHDLYQLHNFKGDQHSILDIFYEERGIPTGSGDCCAPKLLLAAIKRGLTPLGLTEFYFGKTNKSSTRHHKKFYRSCKSKCQPILGYILCGL